MFSLYSLDLILTDYWLFADHKRMLHGKRFDSNEEVISETRAYFKVKNKSFYKKGIEWHGEAVEWRSCGMEKLWNGMEKLWNGMEKLWHGEAVESVYHPRESIMLMNKVEFS